MFSNLTYLLLIFVFYSLSLFFSCGRSSHIPKATSIQLQSIKKTGRISSNHFSDFTVDQNGNCYIASFAKKGDNLDYIFLTRINADGSRSWTIEDQFQGRATAITNDHQGNIYALGIFDKQIKLGKQFIETKKRSIFLAKLNATGEIQQLIRGYGDALAFDIAANALGDVLITGAMGDSVRFGEVVLNNNSPGTRGFMALFDQELNGQWIQALNANTQQIRSTQEGAFLITGTFSNTFIFEKDTLSTTGNYDQDGFVIRLTPDRQSSWIRQFGKAGIIKYGYRTNEGGTDLLELKDGTILVTAILDGDAFAANWPNEQSGNQLALLNYSQEGKLKKRQILISEIASGSITKTTVTPTGNIWLAGNFQKRLVMHDSIYARANNFQSYLLQLDKDWNIQQLLLPKHGKNTLFRASATYQDQVILTGHFQNKLQIENQLLENEGIHELFYLKFQDQN